MYIDKNVPFADCFREFNRDRMIAQLWRLSSKGAPDYEEAPAHFRRRLGVTLESFRRASFPDWNLKEDWYPLLAAVAGAIGRHLAQGLPSASAEFESSGLSDADRKRQQLAAILQHQIGATTFPGALFIDDDKAVSKRDTHARVLASLLALSVSKEERAQLCGASPEVVGPEDLDFGEEYQQLCSYIDSGHPISLRLRESIEALPWAGLASGIRNMFSVRDEKHDHAAPKLDGLYETWQPASVFPGSYVCGLIEFKYLEELGTVIVREEQRHVAKAKTYGPIDMPEGLEDPTYGSPSLWEVHIGVAFPRTAFWMVQMAQQRTRHPKHIWYQQYRYNYDPEGDNTELKYALLIGEFMTSSEHTRVYKGRTIARRVPLGANGKPIECEPQIVAPSKVPTFIYRLLENDRPAGPGE